MVDEPKAMLRITVESLETGEKDETTIPAGEYFVVTALPCYVDGIQAYRTGTHVITIRDRTAR